MSGVNKVILVGYVGQDPQIKFLDGGNSVANFSIATSEKWKDKSGEAKERTEWHRIVAWGKLAEIVGKYVSKGKQVFIEGKLQTREWEKDGVKRYSTEVVAQNLTLLGKKSDGGSETQGGDSDDASF